MTHAMDNQDGTLKLNDTDQNNYANNFGDDLAFYTDNALEYTNGSSLASTNNHNQEQVTSKPSIFNTLDRNNVEFAGLDKTGGDDSILLAILHWGRNAKNKKVSYSDVTGQTSLWKQLPDNQAIFHQMGEGNEENEKYVNPDGREMIYKPLSNNTASLVIDDTNLGTYNYVHPDGSLLNAIGHGILDVTPYMIFGNTPSDMFTVERFKALNNMLKEEEK